MKEIFETPKTGSEKPEQEKPALIERSKQGKVERNAEDTKRGLQDIERLREELLQIIGTDSLRRKQNATRHEGRDTKRESKPIGSFKMLRNLWKVTPPE